MDGAEVSGLPRARSATTAQDPGHDASTDRDNALNLPPRSHRDNVTSLQEACTICLQPVVERAVAVPCNHMTFDFLCLVSWLWQNPTCPLCKARVARVEYDWRGSHDYKTFVVPDRPESVPVQSFGTSRAITHRPQAWSNRRRARGSTTPVALHDPAVLRRREVYRHRLYALHIGANSHSGYQDFTAQDFAASPALQSKARRFFRRELRVFSFLATAPSVTPQRSGSTRPVESGDTGPSRRPYPRDREYLLEYIVFVLQNFDIKGAEGMAQRLVGESLGQENATQLLHELEAWLRSPFSELREWDEAVQYSDRGMGGK